MTIAPSCRAQYALRADGAPRAHGYELLAEDSRARAAAPPDAAWSGVIALTSK